MKKFQIILFVFITIPFVLLAQKELESALSSITPHKIFTHIQMLASDSFEGRKPGTQGETRTINYLINQFKKNGLNHGNPNGSFLQEVPLVNLRPSSATLLIENENQKTEINFPEDLVVESFDGHLEGSIKNLEVVFAGYGIVAPEFGWDDYKNLDVKGKIVIVLSGETLHNEINNDSKTNTDLPKETLTGYYGLRVYKYSIAKDKGAAALFIAHRPQTSPSFKVFQTFLSDQIDLKAFDDNILLKTQGIISWNAFNGLCSLARVNADSLAESSGNRNFFPLRLDIKGSIDVESKQRELISYNVVAKVEGSDKKLKDEFLIYTAHWDHLGLDTSMKGDQIYNGAFDNAVGVASLIEIAAGFSRLKQKPRRSILFIATTAEETRWRGAMFYTKRPLYPLLKTIANINLDGFSNPWGKTKEIGAGGAELSTLEEEIKQATLSHNRVYVRKPEYTDFFFRSDAFEFVKVGVPAITITSMGTDVAGRPEGNGANSFKEYFAQDYHKVSDEIKPGWDLSGTTLDAQFLITLGYQIANSIRKPEWKAETVFKSIREKALNK